MDALQALALALAGMIGLMTTVGGYLLRRLRSLESRQEQRHRDDLATERARAENAERAAREKQGELDTLRGRVTSLEAQASKVPDLEAQIKTLCRQFDDLHKRLDDAEQRDADKQARIEALEAEVKRLEKQNTDLFEANKALTIERNTLQKALIWVGIQRLENHENKLDSDTAGGEDPAPEEIGDKKEG